jgi:hypothetical protein
MVLILGYVPYVVTLLLATGGGWVTWLDCTCMPAIQPLLFTSGDIPMVISWR